ncbi:MAG: hypothetical protein V7703_14890 [Hyphomicrobiales bacterium]
MPAATTEQRHKLNRDPIIDPHVILIEFQEDGESAVERAALNNENIIWEGNTYFRSDIEVQTPSTGDGEISAQLVASNVDRYLSRALDSAKQRINVRIILIDTAEPTTPIIDTQNLLVMPSASANDEGSISAQLAARVGLLEPVPFKRTTKAAFPGVWLA